MTPKALEQAARAALETITPAETIGTVLSSEESDGIANVRFGSNLPGYIGWDWVASLAVDGKSTTVLETELLAGDDAIQAPDWVPWADRLREYEESIAAGIEEAIVVVPDDEIDELDDLDDLDDLDHLDDDDDDELDDLDDDDDDVDDFEDDVDSVDLADIVESPFDDTDVFDGIDDVVSGDGPDEDEYVVVEDN
ncbi:unannotated protein [freshwater metagenome]|uniref:Unannotated protein n=1 Tax=freshwater metagenome TaxID=449393 RepID=A0A6J7DNK8_9ZZZZ